MMSVIMLSVIMLSVIMLSVIMLSVVILIVIMLSVIMLSVCASMLSVIMQNTMALQGGRQLHSCSKDGGFKSSCCHIKIENSKKELKKLNFIYFSCQIFVF